MLDLINPTTLLIVLIGAIIALILGLRLAKDPSFGLVLMAFFLPFERIPSFDIGGFTFKLNHFIGGLTFVFWLLAVVLNRRKIAPNPLTIPLLLVFFTFLLSGVNAGDSFRQLTVYISLLIMLVLYITVINTLASERIVKLLTGALFVSAGLMGLIGIYQFFGDLAGLPPEITGLDPGYTKVVFGFPRVHAFSKEPLYFANFLFIPLGIALALFFARAKSAAQVAADTAAHKKEWFLGLMDRLNGPWLLPLIVLLLINFFLTLSRGAFISAVPFAVVFLIFYARRILTFKNIALGIIVLAISLASVYKILDSVSPDALERFIGHATLEDVLVKKQGESGFGRLEAFGQALEAWGTSPLVGIGLGNFGPYVSYYPVTKPDSGWDIVNNEYFELLAETGILGTASVFLMLGVILWRSVIAYRKAANEYLRAVLVGLMAAFVGMFVQYNFFSTFYIIHIWVLFGLIIGVQNLILQPERLDVDPRS